MGSIRFGLNLRQAFMRFTSLIVELIRARPRLMLWIVVLAQAALWLEAGLLLLTTTAAIWLLLLPIGFALATARGRRMLLSFDPLFALLVVAVLALPYLVWLVRANAGVLPPLPAMDDLGAKALR